MCTVSSPTDRIAWMCEILAVHFFFFFFLLSVSAFLPSWVLLGRCVPHMSRVLCLAGICDALEHIAHIGFQTHPYTHTHTQTHF